MENRPMNHRLIPTKGVASIAKLNDIGFRVILIPFLGISIPLITGMYKGLSLGHWEFKLSFVYSIGIAFVIWQGNRYLLFTLRSYFDWFNQPVRKVIVLLVSVTCYSLPVSVLLLV